MDAQEIDPEAASVPMPGVGIAGSREADGIDTAHVRAKLGARLFGAAAEPLRVGRYSILRRVGAGAMGVVYAGYDETLDRRVAIKLVPDTAQSGAPARVLREAQALGRLSHPNVVAVHEVGRHIGPDDAPLVFIAMEFVRGATLRDWCQAETRTTAAMLEALVQVGRGLVAAHQAGIVHRDVKPDNVMIGHDGRVRLMDFGLARADLDATLRTLDDWELDSGAADPFTSGLATRTGGLVGTPAYMAPEHFARGEIGAAADQFAWCVMAWELLAGERPFLGRSLTELAANVSSGRRTEPKRFAAPARVRRILERGLEPRIDGRWPDMATLLAQLERDGHGWWRTGAAVVLVGGIATAALVRDDTVDPCANRDPLASTWNDDARTQLEHAFVATGASFAADAWVRVATELGAYIEAWRAADLALCKGDTAAVSDDLRTASALCLEDRRRALEAQIEVLGAADRATIGNAVRAVLALPAVASCSDVAFLGARVKPPDDPAIAAKVDELDRGVSTARAFIAAGDFASALVTATPLVPTARELDYLPALARTLAARSRAESGMGRFAIALATGMESYVLALEAGDDELAADIALEVAFLLGTKLSDTAKGLEWSAHAGAHVRRLGDGTEAEARLQAVLGSLHEARGSYEEGLQHHVQSLALQRARHQDDHPHIAEALQSIGIVYARRGEFEAARDHFAQAEELLTRASGPDHPDVAMAMTNHATAYQELGKYDVAVKMLERAIEIRERALGKDHPDVAESLNNLGNVFERLGDRPRALECYRRALGINEKVYGAVPNRRLSDLHNNIGVVLDTTGAYDDAVGHFLKALEMDTAILGPRHPDIAFTLTNLGIANERVQKWEAALDYYHQALAIREESIGKNHPDVADTLIGLGNVYKDMKRHDEALANHERALAIKIEALGPTHPNIATSYGNLGNVYRSMGDNARAIEYFDNALELRIPALGRDHPRTAWIHQQKGEAQLDEKRWADAAASFEEALRVRLMHEVPPADLADSRFGLGQTLMALGRDRTRAIELVEQARDALAKIEHRADGLRHTEAWLARHWGR